MNYTTTNTLHSALRKVATAIMLVVVGLCCQSAFSQTISTTSIIDEITSDSVNILILPDGLDQRLQPGAQYFEEELKPNRQSNNPRIGYRIQIFNDGNQRTAKNAANSRRSQVAAKFPQYRISVDYKSPFWRVRLGDFKNQQDAQEAANQIKRAFPAFSKEIRVVKDAIIPSVAEKE